jgi:transaldolase
MDAFRDHGVVERTVDSGYEEAGRHLAALVAAGVDLAEVTDTLLAEGIAAFQRSFDSLLAGLARKSAELVAAG